MHCASSSVTTVATIMYTQEHCKKICFMSHMSLKFGVCECALPIVHCDCECWYCRFFFCFLFIAFFTGVVVDTVYCWRWCVCDALNVFGCNLFVQDYFISNLCKRNHFDVCTMHSAYVEKFTSYQKHLVKRKVWAHIIYIFL